MSEERRREPRLDAASLNLLVYDNLSGDAIGSLVNLSRNGMMLLSDREVDPGGILQVDLRSRSTTEDKPLHMGLQISWTSPANTEGNYWIGARIIAIGKPEAKQLESLLRATQSTVADNT